MHYSASKLSVFPVLVYLIACASSGGLPSGGTRVDRVQIQGTDASYDIPLTTDAYETTAVLDWPADTVWRAVPSAYAALNIPTEGNDPTHRLFIGNLTARSQFARQPISRFVDCGTSLTGPNADSYNIHLRLSSQVDSVGSARSNLRTRLEATGTGMGGTTVRCTSSGELERQLSIRVKLLLVKQGGTSP